MSRRMAWVIAALCLVGCTMPSGTGPKGTTAASEGTVGNKPPGKTPVGTAGTATGGTLTAKTRHGGIVDAIQSTLVAGDLARSQNTVELLSDNGLGLISDNGLGLISDNGLGYRITATDPSIEYEDTNIQKNLAWHSVFYKPDYHGEIKSFDKDEYAAKGDAAAVLEHYTWGALGINFKNPTFPVQFPVDARLTYTVTPVKSARFGFIKTMTLKFDVTVKSIDPKPVKVVYNGLGCSYDVAAPLADGTQDVMTMDAYDFTYPAGKGPGAETFTAPSAFKAKGANDRGTLNMTLDRSDTTDAMTISATHADKAGAHVSKLNLTIDDQGGAHSVVTDVDNNTEAVLDYAADRTGKGQVRTVGTHDVLGTITWGNDGMGTITFTDGGTEKVRVF